MPLLKEITLPSGYSANYWRIQRIDWQEILVSAELVANPDYNSENPEPETIANPAYVDAETTPDEPETIANPAYEPPQIWSPVYEAQAIATMGVYKSRDAFYQGSQPVTTRKHTFTGENNPFRHANLGKTYAELYSEAYVEIKASSMPEAELIA
jgi:hypothetical protein